MQLRVSPFYRRGGGVCVRKQVADKMSDLLRFGRAIGVDERSPPRSPCCGDERELLLHSSRGAAELEHADRQRSVLVTHRQVPQLRSAWYLLSQYQVLEDCRRVTAHRSSSYPVRGVCEKLLRILRRRADEHQL